MKLVIILFSLFTLAFSQRCSSSWSQYKSIVEGPFASDDSYQYLVNRTTEMQCSRGNRIKFRTMRNLIPANIFLKIFTRFSGFGSCTFSCSEKTVKVNVVYISANLNLNSVSDTTFQEETVSFQYPNKNCNKLYWTSWSETSSSCRSSAQVQYTRSCVDCDGEIFPFPQYCFGTGVRFCPSFPSQHSTSSSPGPVLTSTQKVESPILNLFILLGGGGGATLVLIIIITFVCSKCCNKRKKRRRLQIIQTISSRKSMQSLQPNNSVSLKEISTTQPSSAPPTYTLSLQTSPPPPMYNPMHPNHHSFFPNSQIQTMGITQNQYESGYVLPNVAKTHFSPQESISIVSSSVANSSVPSTDTRRTKTNKPLLCDYDGYEKPVKSQVESGANYMEIDD